MPEGWIFTPSANGYLDDEGNPTDDERFGWEPLPDSPFDVWPEGGPHA